MSEQPSALGNLKRGWGEPAAGCITGSRHLQFGAAVWANDRLDETVVGIEPDPLHHIMTFPLKRCFTELWIDGVQVFAKERRPGGFQLVKAGQRTRGIIRGSWRYLHVYVPTDLVESVAEQVYSPSRGIEFIDPRGNPDPQCARIADALLTEIQTADGLSALRADALALELAIVLLRNHSTLPNGRHAERLARGGLAPIALRRTIEMLRAGVGEDVRLEDLAREAQLSPYHFCRAFKQSTGLSPYSFLRRLRIEAAKEMLESSHATVTEVALSVGYEAAPAFNRVFHA